VYVADRENSRVQRFDPEGAFLSEWTDVARPCQVAVDVRGNLLVAELGFHIGLWPGMPEPDASPVTCAEGGPVTCAEGGAGYLAEGGGGGGRMSVFDPQGRLLSRWGGGQNPAAPGDFLAPHDVCVDSTGALYVGEVIQAAARAP